MSDPTFPLPENTGDCYALIGYIVPELTILGFAYRGPGPEEGKWGWWLDLSDGDQYPCNSVAELYQNCPVEKVVLVRRATDGLAPKLREALTAEEFANVERDWRFDRLLGKNATQDARYNAVVMAGLGALNRMLDKKQSCPNYEPKETPDA